MKKNNLPIYFAIAVIFGIVIGAFLSNGNLFELNQKSANEQKMKRLMNYIERDYVDDVNTDELLDGAISEMLKKLDPHSVYIPKEELQAVTENMQGNFVGIGVQFRMINDTITIVKPMKDGASIKVGIKAGDRILIANKDTLYNKKITTEQIFKSLKGELGSQVKLQVYRKSNDSLFSVNITRSKINIKSVEVAYMLKDSLGYIKLDRFSQNAYPEFKQSLDNLLSNGMKSLVLDLRGNGGGFIHIANKIADEFLEDKKLIVFTKNNKKRVKEYFATEKGSFEKGHLYVLIDESSASASEIVAGALQDNDKGVIIGRRSFGKGLVQEELGLGDGSAVRLTIARYYTPTGRSIQKPYHSEKQHGTEDYKEEIYKRNAELFNKDSIKITDSLAFKTPKGKVVYGGGGIIPDVFIPIDSTKFISPMYFKPLNDFVFDYVDKHRNRLSKIKFKDFEKTYNKDEVFTEFKNYLKRQKIYKVHKFNLSKNIKNRLENYLKILIVRDVFSDEQWYKFKQKDDKMIQKVLELEGSK